ncbi:MAG TPA: SGNH/GDSL hydrolase family protein [Terriglobales bacterium]|nr:SGNH/GDSL hydrolase family protein [Terriglobales bacterium]HUL14967.1 SGNH/GDSL hydrolase family protein [Terriglobales bacterium]
MTWTSVSLCSRAFHFLRAKNFPADHPRMRWASLPFAVLCFAILSAAGVSPLVAQGISSNATRLRKVDLSNMVVVGDSLSAGFQNDSLLDSQQPNGWASLLALQAQVPLKLPLILPPGIPNVLQLISAGPPPIVLPIPGVSPGRDDPFVQPTDLAVPDALLQDALSTRPTLPISDLTGLVLGLPGLYATPPVSLSQAEWAQALQPTIIFVWIGNNDILGAATSANPSGATSLTSFNANYKKLLDELAGTRATLVVANIPDVTVAPYFTPAGTIAQETGLPLLLLAPILGIGPGDYVLPDGVDLIPGILSGSIPGPLPSSDVLRLSQVLEARALVDGYNLIIAAQAFTHGAVLVDVHSLANQIRSQGVNANGVHLTNAFLGGIFSLDGVHPTNTGYAVIANQFITTLNAARGTSIPLVDINKVAASDPLVFAGLAPSASLAQHVTPAAAQVLRSLLLHVKPQ